MLAALGRRLEAGWFRAAPWTNVYGIGRSLLALSTFLTLVFNRSDVLFRPIAGVALAPPFCSEPLQRIGIFCIAGSHVDLARWLGAASMLLVASGWRPRITGVLHWWIAASFEVSASTLEGGDQAAGNLALILIPVTLCDGRRWHWDPKVEIYRPGLPEAMKYAISLASMIVLRIQVSGIYFHAAAGKLAGTEWQNGTAMYYWLSHPVFGANPAWEHIVNRLMGVPFIVSSVTWGTIVLELFLCMGLVATRRIRRVLLPLGFAFHLAILLFMGLFTFALTMWGALVLYLRPWDEPYRQPEALRRSPLSLWATGRSRGPVELPAPTGHAPRLSPPNP